MRVVVSMLGAAGLIVFGMSGELRNRLWSLAHTTEDPHVIYRADIIANAVSVGLDSPFFGNGYGRDHLRVALKRKHPEITADGFVSHTHNLYAELIAGVGFLGLAVFAWALASAGIQLIRKIARRAVTDKERYADPGAFGFSDCLCYRGAGRCPVLPS